MPARRELSFGTLDAAVADARHLLVAGYTRAGNWSLGQACGHLALFVRLPIDGVPPLPLGIKVVGFLVRNTIGPGLKRKMLATGKIPAGRPAIRETVLPADADDTANLTEFETQIERLRKFTGVPHPSPLLGPITNGELVRLTCIHAALHLGFLVPNDTLADPTRRN